MSSTESQTLALLEAIERDSNLSQRDLARITGLNVAKVNYLIKKFVDKGHVKLKNVSRNPNKLRYLYLLTPQGAFEKSRLAYYFMRRALKQYSVIEFRVREVLDRLTQQGVTSVALLGGNEISEVVSRICAEVGTPVIVSTFPDTRSLMASLDSRSDPGFAKVIVCEFDVDTIAQQMAESGIAMTEFVILN